MSTLDELRNRRKNNFVSFKPDVYLDVRMNETQKPVFVYWDGEKEKNIAISKPLEGFFIGFGMVMEAFDPKFGKKGGTYKSTTYFTKRDMVNLYNPAGAKETRMEAGELQECMASFTSGAVNVKKAMYIYIVSKTSGQVLAIKTNLSIGLEQVQGYEKNGMVNDYWLKLTPTVYSADDNDIKKAHKFLGPLAATNPPKYAKISTSTPLDDATLEKYDAVTKLDTFLAWKDGITNGTEVAPEVNKEITPQGQEAIYKYEQQTQHEVANMPPPDDMDLHRDIPDDFEDDQLPF